MGRTRIVGLWVFFVFNVDKFNSTIKCVVGCECYILDAVWYLDEGVRMKFINILKEIEGKTVKSAQEYNTLGDICIVFTDKTCVCTRVTKYGDESYVALAKGGDLSNEDRLNGGLMGLKELRAIRKEEAQQERHLKMTKEIEELTRLLDKYGVPEERNKIDSNANNRQT